MNGDLRIGDWDVQSSINRLKRGDEVVRLEPKVMHVLLRLAQTPGEVVTREDLIASVWPGVFVTDDVLHRAIRELRRVFGDSPANPRYLETIRKRGYRLIAPTSIHKPPNSVSSVPGAPEIQTTPVPVRGGGSASWLFSGIALAVALMCTLAVFAVAWRAGQTTSEAAARFVPLVSGPLNETDPAISPDGSQVAYVQRHGGDIAPADIYIRNLVDGRTTRVTTHAASERMPAWSRDGQQLAFIRATPSTCEVIVRALSTGVETRVTACGNRHDPHMTWTADGQALLMSSAFASQAHSGWRIARVDLVSGTTTMITEPPPGIVGDHSPVVSPDGRRVSFIRRASGGVSDIYVAPLTGGSARRLTFDEADLTGIDWTSDGRSMLFSSDRAGGYTLWRVAADGGEPTLVAGGAARMKHPVADRSGRRVVYENWNYEIDVWQSRIAAAEARDDSRPVTQTSDLWNLYPQVSPDGRRLVYVSTQSGNHELWLADRDGANARQLTHIGRGVVKEPRWSPDGRRVVFLARQHGALDVQTVDVFSGDVKALTSTTVNEIAPAWSHDGREVLFGAPDSDGYWSVWAVDTTISDRLPRLRISNAVAAQTSSDGEWVYFTKPDVSGLWRARTGNSAIATLVVESIPAGNSQGWLVTAQGVYFVEDRDDGVRLRLARSGDGSSMEVATLHQLTWPGFSISPDGAHVLYARWGRRESNIMSIEY